jgi:hypothetical protein
LGTVQVGQDTVNVGRHEIRGPTHVPIDRGAAEEQGFGKEPSPSENVGSTGKYAGIAGEYTFADEYIGNVRDNVFGGMGRKSGSYKISK